MIWKQFISFTRRRITFFIIPSLLFSLVFILYQVHIFIQLSKEQNEIKLQYRVQTRSDLPKGIHVEQASFYTPDHRGQFLCVHSQEVIPFTKVNDDYCDCLDGTDEPGTNACPNGLFYCGVTANGFPTHVKSPKVNDGICDCCDGSDEWDNNQVLKDQIPHSSKHHDFLFHRYPPCKRLC
ncbi:unnamed protein product [Acanthoscelides obtectus]|uniref:Glucosidase II beta subunit N-terminal domain-containing protein n=1 Tax=Acanthoscelides obtectus TaxID=200917 RepID=A0A9P0KH34_ACAOB|nr:unnamed protein product [Acanthoscelides obtectus]CAK1629328.1 Glucosidase 2 subunit beta [Acanthoscelides obtectus]